MIGALLVFPPKVRKGFRRDMWHPIFDSGRGENRWSVSNCGQQILAEQIMEAVIENLLKRDPQGLPMIQSCETLLKVKDISLGIFWMQPSQWVWWYVVSLFCIYSVFWSASALISSWKTNLESFSHFNRNAPFPRLNVVYSIQPVNLWKWGGLAAYWSGLSTKYVSGSKMWIYVVWGQTVSRQLELGHNAALSSSQGSVSLVFHVNDGPDSRRLPQSFFVSRCVCPRKAESKTVNVEQCRSISHRLRMAWRICSFWQCCISYSFRVTLHVSSLDWKAFSRRSAVKLLSLLIQVINQTASVRIGGENTVLHLDEMSCWYKNKDVGTGMFPAHCENPSHQITELVPTLPQASRRRNRFH